MCKGGNRNFRNICLAHPLLNVFTAPKGTHFYILFLSSLSGIQTTSKHSFIFGVGLNIENEKLEFFFSWKIVTFLANIFTIEKPLVKIIFGC